MKEHSNQDFTYFNYPKGVFKLEDTSEKLEDTFPDSYMDRLRVYFYNGHELSIIKGSYSYGGKQGLFEIMSTGEVLDTDSDGIEGYLTQEEVQRYIDAVAQLPTKEIK